MAINIKNIEELLQKKAYAVDSATPVSDLADMVEAALLSTNSLQQYDSAGLLPIASSTNVKIAFISSDKSVRFNMGGKWDSLTSGGSRAASASVHDGLGSTYGYAAGGFTPVVNTIDKFSFTSDGNATDVGDLTVAVSEIAGNASSTHGYAHGIDTPTTTDGGIEKWQFASDQNSSTVGDLSVARDRLAGNTYSASHGYASGGNGASDVNGINVIDKYSFSADGNATDVGDLLQAYYNLEGTTYETHGYVTGGYRHPANYYNNIQRFAFASDGNAVDVGDTTGNRSVHGGSGQSLTSGFFFGGYNNPYDVSQLTTIEQYPFASTANSTDAGDLTLGVSYNTGQSSTTHVYSSGGYAPSTAADTDTIEKFPHSSATSTTDVGNLTVARRFLAGTQY